MPDLRAALKRCAAAAMLAACAPIALQLALIARHEADIHRDVAALAPASVGALFGAKVYGDDDLSPIAEERTRAAALLYREGAVARIFVSGTNSDNAEVDEMAERLIELGVPGAAIERDDHGVNTLLTCQHLAAAHPGQRAVLITQGFHLPRSLAMCAREGAPAQGIAVNALGLLGPQGTGFFTVWRIRAWRFLREAALSAMWVLGVYR